MPHTPIDPPPPPPPPELQVANIETAIATGFKICTERVAGAATRNRQEFAGAVWAKDLDGLDGLRSRSDVLGWLDAPQGSQNRCDVAVARAEDVYTLQGQGEHCNKALVGQAIDHVIALRRSNHDCHSWDCIAHAISGGRDR